MVTNITSLGRSGLYDWVIQRVSAVVIALYVIIMLGYLMTTSDLTYDQWVGFMGSPGMKILNVVALLGIIAHAWVGLWTISTDYIKPFVIRCAFQVGTGLLALVYLVWAVNIFWGI